MARPTSSIIFSLLLLPLLLLKMVESQNTNFSINVFTPHSEKLTYERDAVVPADEPFVRLTPLRNTVGRVLYNAPVQLWGSGKQASFETTITLQITSIPSIPVGYGMTFFIVPVNSTTSSGGTFEFLGIYDAVLAGTPIFAVEIDFYSSSSLNPNYSHIGINFNSRRSQNTTRVEDDIIGQRVTARITYDVPTRKINMVATYGSTNATVSYVFNLAALLPQQVQLGISASAGTSRSAYFDAYTWHFNSTMVTDVNSLVNKSTYVKQYIM